MIVREVRRSFKWCLRSILARYRSDLVIVGRDHNSIEATARDGSFNRVGKDRQAVEVADVLALNALASATRRE